MDNMLFLAIDADNAGRLVGRAVLADDTEGLTEVSSRIDHGQEIILSWAQKMGGQRISSGGDEANVSVPPSALEQIEMLRKDYEHATGMTLTVGVGQSLSQAGKALMAGKVRGKNQVVQYDDSVEQDLVNTGKNAAAGTGTEEEQKINEAYLQKDDEAVPVDDHDHANCEYCKEYDAKNGDNPEALCDCPYCAQYDAEHSHDNCPYCQEYDAKQAGGSCDCPYCQEYDAKQAAAPAAGGDQAPLGVAPDGQPAGPGSVDELPPETGLGANGMIANTSHPQGYDDNVPGDMGLAEGDPSGQPDLSQVLQGGLDNQADSIQLEKVSQMVAQALDKIKGQKQIIEKAKEQAPDLYMGVILMMKSMIEMAKMLGFGQEVEQEVEDAAPQSAQPAVAPDAPAAPGGAAPAPKPVGQ